MNRGSRMLVALLIAATGMGWDASPTPRGAAAAAADCSTWNLAADFAASPYANPNPASCGNFDVWEYLSGPRSTVAEPFFYQRLTRSHPNEFPGNGQTIGLHTWARF